MHMHVEMLRGKQDVVTDIELEICAVCIGIAFLSELSFVKIVFGTRQMFVKRLRKSCAGACSDVSGQCWSKARERGVYGWRPFVR